MDSTPIKPPKKQKPKGLDSWEKLKTKPDYRELYQNFGTLLEPVNINDGPFAPIKYGMQNRWKVAIARGAIAMMNNNERVFYDGDGKFISTRSPQKALSLSTLAEDAIKDKGKKTKRSGPQNAKIVLRHGKREIHVTVKLFDYIYIERLISNNPLDDKPLEWCTSSLKEYYQTVPGLLSNAAYDDQDEQDDGDVMMMDISDDESDINISSNNNNNNLGITSSYFNNQEMVKTTKPTPQAEVRIQVAYYVNGMIKNPALSKEERKIIWQIDYGQELTATCILCQTNRINFGKTDNHLCHVCPKAKGGHAEKLYNFIYACTDCNQTGPFKDGNLFDQLIAAHKLYLVKKIADLQLRKYCVVECKLNVNFENRINFVFYVFGTYRPKLPESHCNPPCGITLFQDVAKTLKWADVHDPLPRHYFNPALKKY